jgi:hypothetical protein
MQTLFDGHSFTCTRLLHKLGFKSPRSTRSHADVFRWSQLHMQTVVTQVGVQASTTVHKITCRHFSMVTASHADGCYTSWGKPPHSIRSHADVVDGHSFTCRRLPHKLCLKPPCFTHAHGFQTDSAFANTHAHAADACHIHRRWPRKLECKWYRNLSHTLLPHKFTHRWLPDKIVGMN